MKLADRVNKIQPSPTLAIDAKAKAMKAEGIDVIDLSVGEPDFATPENVKDAGIKAIRDNFTKYTENDGIPTLRKAIAQRLCISQKTVENHRANLMAKLTLHTTRPRRAAECCRLQPPQDAAGHARNPVRRHRRDAAEARKARRVRRHPAAARGGHAGKAAARARRWDPSTCPAFY